MLILLEFNTIFINMLTRANNHSINIVGSLHFTHSDGIGFPNDPQVDSPVISPSGQHSAVTGT